MANQNFNLPPPPNPNTDMSDYSWKDWFARLRDYIVNKGLILWNQIDFTGSNITDVQKRSHQDLQNLQGGNSAERYHMTAVEHTGTGSGVFVRKTNPTIDSPNVDNIDFDLTTTNPAHSEGKVFYDHTDHSLCYYNEDADVTLNIGREQLVRVYNNTGSSLLNGKMVYVNGANSGWPTVTLAKADTSVDSQSTLGMVTADIPNASYGYVCVSGTVNGLDTSAYSAGDTLYLSASVAGGITKVAPLQPNYVVQIGTIILNDATNGRIFVSVDKQPWFPNGEIRLTAASTALPTTPAIFTAPSVITQQGISYDNATGVLTFNVSGSYTLSHTLNCLPSAANKKVYFYVEESSDGGTTWTITRYSARQLELINGTETQLVIAGARYYATGTKIRYYIWGDATVSLVTTDLPGTTPGTVTLPAYRLTLAG